MQRGFTLLELIAVLTIMSLMTAVSVHGYQRHIHAAEAQELVLNLRLIASLRHGSGSSLEACAAHPAEVPTQSISWGASKCFARLGFTPGQTRFQYELVVPGPEGAEWALRGRADLDRDGETSLYELRSNDTTIHVQRGLE